MVMKKMVRVPQNHALFRSTDELGTICPAGIPQVDAEAFEGFMVNFFGEPGKECIRTACHRPEEESGIFKEAFLKRPLAN